MIVVGLIAYVLLFNQSSLYIVIYTFEGSKNEIKRIRFIDNINLLSSFQYNMQTYIIGSDANYSLDYNPLLFLT